MLNVVGGLDRREGMSMAKRIATVSTVFAACDRLDAANERWNREDVRNEVGGGGYVVIDPLIRAWRALKPLREAAPNTPAELLHQVAASIDAHITDFTDRIDARMTESRTIFEAAVSTLSEKVCELEADLAEKTQALEEALASNTALAGQLGNQTDDLKNAREEIARLGTANDSLRGQMARTEHAHNTVIKTLQAEAKDLVKEHAQERARLREEHVAALADQRHELTEAAEQAENRLMGLLDQERQDAKATASTLSGNLDAVTQKVQSQRETIVALETSVEELNRQKCKLEAEQAARAESHTDLHAALEKQKAATGAIQQAFNAYKQQHALGSELGALQDAVAGLQAQMIERRNNKHR